MRGGARRLAGIALHMNLARHHVLANTDTGIAFDDHRRLLVHARAVIARVPHDLDRDRRIEADRKRMLAKRIFNTPECPRWCLADRA